jgi:hypothetical protein
VPPIPHCTYRRNVRHNLILKQMILMKFKMMNKILIFIPLVLISCRSIHQPPIKETICIDTFVIRHPLTPNLDAATFVIKTDDSLRYVLKNNNWDSIEFIGGIFDSINFNCYKVKGYPHFRGTYIETNWTEMETEDYFIRFRDIFEGSQNQLDSISVLTLSKVEITIYSKSRIWKLSKCNKFNN